MTHPAPDYDDYEAWQDLRDVLEERNAEYWAENSEAESDDD